MMSGRILVLLHRSTATSRSLLQRSRPSSWRCNRLPTVSHYSNFFPAARKPPPTIKDKESDAQTKYESARFDPDIGDTEEYFANDPIDILENRADQDYPTEEEIQRATIPSNVPVLFVRSTCKSCNTRSGHFITQQAFDEGTVIMFCPECRHGHVFVDRLQAFPESMDDLDLEKVMNLVGDSIAQGNRGFNRDNVVELRPPGPMSPEELEEFIEDEEMEADDAPKVAKQVEDLLDGLGEGYRDIATQKIMEMEQKFVDKNEKSSSAQNEEAYDDDEFPEGFRSTGPSYRTNTKAQSFNPEEEDEMFSEFFTNNSTSDDPPVDREYRNRLMQMSKEELEDLLRAELDKYKPKKPDDNNV
ncbi:hypothetical protein V1512DRAFT_237275 [Lipomyces arxii]|uniref:uncharacterized protein n=1 Tax=Lipomyces arxii TaxID=56418 RepID=UPI0034CDF98C